MAILPEDAPIDLFEAGRVSDAHQSAYTRLAILVAESAERHWHALDVFEICPWTEDDHVEYLAKTHRAECPGVLTRLRADPLLTTLGGSPQLLTLVMDRMAGDPDVLDAHDALWRLVPVFFPPGELTAQLVTDTVTRAHPLGGAQLRPEQWRWWRHDAVRRVVAGEWLADQIAAGRWPVMLNMNEGRELLAHIARAVRDNPAALAELERQVREDPTSFGVPMAASLLLAVDPEWRPANGRRLYLRRACLRGARWSGLDLTGAALMGTDFTGADLSRAILDGVTGVEASLAGACLRGARLGGAKFQEANFAGADLSEAHGENASFAQANLGGANFRLAALPGAKFHEADLTGAHVRGANLSKGAFVRARVDDADFAGARLDETTFDEVRMEAADWSGASFRGAKLRRAVLEWVELPRADFTGADLTGALLTGSRIEDGRFAGAVLREAGLAEIDWTGADLKSADLTDASFHLGSTRSGLVGSTVPCEGSRTGFYTDEFNEQEYKSPEEIRKACLCGADLRGAVTEGTDFYLVDLRGARYTAQQREFFRGCGAILC
jgi:uncharacterized protein YjbI with pentapeptide repeats